MEKVNGLDEFYAPVRRGVAKLVEGYSHLLIVKGRAGLGKSKSVRDYLKEYKADFLELSGDVTEAYLYRLIFQNNGRILWLKDSTKVLQSKNTLNLLKAACETEKQRLLTKSNYSVAQADLPDSFFCRSSFVFDYNHLFELGLSEDLEALISRGDYVELAFSDDDVKQILRLIARNTWQKEVTEYLIDQFESNALVRLNLRTQWKAFKTFQYAQKNVLDWKVELKQELSNVSKTRALLYTLIGNGEVRTADLKRMLVRQEIIPTLRTAHRRVAEWLELEELYKMRSGGKNYYVSINPPKKKRVSDGE